MFASISQDCPDVISLARGLNMHLIQPTSFFQLQVDCCNVVSVTCDTNSSRVTGIGWSNLNGTINGTALPGSLTVFTISPGINRVGGPIPNTLPNNMTYVGLNGNKINGSIPNTLPSSLSAFYLSQNRLSGTLPSVYPAGLKYFWVNGNSLTGELSTTLPTLFSELGVNDNKLTGSLPDFSGWANLRVIFLFNNLVAGDVPDLMMLSKMQTFNVKNNLLTGQLYSFPESVINIDVGNNHFRGPVPLVPRTILNLLMSSNAFTGTLIVNNPTQLMIKGNLISGLILNNTGSLTVCDISNNPLLGYPGILNLTMCSQSGLFLDSFTSVNIGN